jgi:hypothetical protein
MQNEVKKVGLKIKHLQDVDSFSLWVKLCLPDLFTKKKPSNSQLLMALEAAEGIIKKTQDIDYEAWMFAVNNLKEVLNERI